jgi:hypothetical protein
MPRRLHASSANDVYKKSFSVMSSEGKMLSSLTQKWLWRTARQVTRQSDAFSSQPVDWKRWSSQKPRPQLFLRMGRCQFFFFFCGRVNCRIWCRALCRPPSLSTSVRAVTLSTAQPQWTENWLSRKILEDVWGYDDPPLTPWLIKGPRWWCAALASKRKKKSATFFLVIFVEDEQLTTSLW